MNYITLSNGVKMPQLGYGVYQVTKDECERCVTDALEVGYRLIDTAQSYFNEEEVGNAIAKSGVPRQEIFLTTKVWIWRRSPRWTRGKALSSPIPIRIWWNGSRKWWRSGKISTAVSWNTKIGKNRLEE